MKHKRHTTEEIIRIITDTNASLAPACYLPSGRGAAMSSDGGRAGGAG